MKTQPDCYYDMCQQWGYWGYMLHANNLIKGLEEVKELQFTMQSSVSTGYIEGIVH